MSKWKHEQKFAVGLIVALVVFGVISSTVLAQGGVNVQKLRALLVELSATVNQNLTVKQDVTVGDDLSVTGDAAVTGNLTVTGSFDGASGLTVSAGTVSLPASEIGAAEIANVTRAINISIFSLFECSTNAGAAIPFTDGTDTRPHFANSPTNGLGAVLRFDDTAASEDTDFVCGALMVPSDYTSGGAFIVRAVKDALTAGNTEILNCAGSINGAALGTAGTVTIATQASTAYTCTPTLTGLAANDSVSFELHLTSSGTVDDITDIAAIEFTYTSTQ